MRLSRATWVAAIIVGLVGCASPATTPTPAVSAAPRVIEITASDDLKFSPATVSVKPGEAVVFRIKNVGQITHEFMVGPTGAVEADGGEGTAELEDIAAGETKDLAFTFGTSGTYAFACHVPGHFEAGMKGAVTLGS